MEKNTKASDISKKFVYKIALITVTVSLIVGTLGGISAYLITDTLSNDDVDGTREILSQDVTVINEDSAVIDVANAASEAVVSIVITQDVPIFEEYDPWSDLFGERNRQEFGTQERQVGAGTGFIISSDGMVVTNRHVVDQEDADYTVIFPDGSRKSADLIASDTLLDIAFMQIEEPGEDISYLEIGSSSQLKVGQSVIAIGNALGQFGNTVSLGIVSGLSRDIVASNRNGSNSGQLNGLIQTDASINFGNSGGPLLDLTGKVIGVNVAVANDAENIGFAIPANEVLALIERLDRTNGEIDRPFLGVRYQLVNDALKEELDLPADYGAIIVGENGTENFAIIENSPASKAGLKVNDVILEVDGVRINEENPLSNIIQEKFIGDIVTLVVLRDGGTYEVDVELEALP
jgi:serine protease Do